MGSKAWFDAHTGIHHVETVDKMSVEDFREINRQTPALPPEKNRLSQEDLSRMENPLWDKGTRQMLAAETGEQGGVRVAIVGVLPTLRVLAGIFARKTKYEVKLFGTEVEAVQRLKGE